MKIRFLTPSRRPAVDAVVCVAAAPVSHPDIGMITDDEGCISLPVNVPGQYSLIVSTGGDTHRVDVTFHEGQASVEVCLPE
jgi:hypothetical protein